MKTETPQQLKLIDYKTSNYEISNVELFFDLHEDFCRVQSEMNFYRTSVEPSSLILDGVDLKLISIRVDGAPLSSVDYIVTETSLEILKPKEKFNLQIEVEINPAANTSLEGLYKTSTLFCTQCEAQGFRKITYFLDRPDVMTQFTVCIEADEKKYPVLLSNGDRVSTKQISKDRHQVIWSDPFKKPCYLFALVAGDLAVLKDTFTTQSGKIVNLEIYADEASVKTRCFHAMDSLKKSMKWDEERFGREYDLSTYMIVATDDFNAGAMENKGLNIFNSRLVLADEKSATDDDYFNIESVVAHEYFHNWTGNRITLRDWFHLSLKEGLTVFRDQEFSMDQSSRSVVRIDSVKALRNRQFPEDAGPNAHPIRPESCFAVDNFFTPTIYEKGAEVIRMMQTMVGRPGFRKGMDLYFKKHDGKAVIIEDFASCISEANNQSWDQFKLWYSQAGTPTVHVQEDYVESERKYTLILEQSCPPSPGQPEKKDFHIPLILGLIGPDGKEMSWKCNKVEKNTEDQNLLHLKSKKEVFLFENVPSKPRLSLNRGFSAPIYLDWKQSQEDLLFLLSHDSDDFNRWEAGQTLALETFKEMITSNSYSKTNLLESYLKGLEFVLISHLDESMKALLLKLPEDSFIVQNMNLFEADRFQKARKTIEQEISNRFKPQFYEIYLKYHNKNNDSRSPVDFGKRSFKNTALRYLSLQSEGADLAFEQFQNAKIMTDQESALRYLCMNNNANREKALDQFHKQWKSDPLVLNKWFVLQSESQRQETFSDVIKLWDHPDFNKKNPNRVYSLLLKFGQNLTQFHNEDLDCYSFFAEKIAELDTLNPQVATRVSSCFNLLPKLSEKQKRKATLAIEELLGKGLSKNTYEIVSKIRAVTK